MFNYNGKTDNDLRQIAQTASSDFLQTGTELTQAVVKAASAVAPDFTSEHIRRICEMTYHDTYSRMFNEKQGSTDKDRYISFDPPNAIVAGDLYMRSQQSALPVGGGPVPSFLGKMAADTIVPLTKREVSPRKRLSKIAASQEEVMSQRFTPINQFDAVVGSYSPSEIPAHDSAKGVREIYMAVKEAKQEISGRLSSSETTEKLAMSDLVQLCVQMSKEGMATDQILHACFSSCNMSDTHVAETAKKVASEIALVLPREKLASEFGEVNRKHPVLKKFAEAVMARSERIHLEYALSDIQRGEQDVKKALFGS